MNTLGAFFRPVDASLAGITYDRLQGMVRAGLVERVGRGLYRRTDIEPTEHHSLAATCARVPGAIVCLLSALQVHGIGSRVPAAVWLGVPNKARAPRHEEREYPILLDGLPAPRIRVYRREVSVAEKFQAMVNLGLRNSRMKDFHDIWALTSTFAFEGPVLRAALVACFERRGTAWSQTPPDVLRAAFYENPLPRGVWSDYLGSGTFAQPPPTAFETIGERVRAFLGPVRESILLDAKFDQDWPQGGPWSPPAGTTAKV